MDDSVSHDSDDSLLTSDEFEIIQTAEPELNIAGNGNLEDLKQSLNEVLMDPDVTVSGVKIEDSARKMQDTSYAVCDQLKTPMDSNKLLSKDDSTIEQQQKSVSGDRLILDLNINAPDEHRVTQGGDSGGSDVTLYAVSPSSPSDDGSTLQSPSLAAVMPDGIECSLFNRITYLGAAAINAPRSEGEIQRNMAILNAQALEHAIEVTLSVPSTSEGSVVLFEPNSSVEIASFKIHRIIFCARGKPDTPEAGCIAFTCSHGDVVESNIFHQCHIFKCEVPETADKVVMCFACAFSRAPKVGPFPQAIRNDLLLTDSLNESSNQQFIFEVSLEVREEDTKGNFNACPKDKICFKLRSNILKKVVMSVQQVYNSELPIERCFGLLISPGRNVNNDDMHLLDDVSMSITSGENKMYTAVGQWDPCDPAFEILNTETNRDTRIHMTVAIDLVIVGIQEPVRFSMQTKVKVYSQNERFWYYTRKQQMENFHLWLKEVSSSDGNNKTYDVVKLQTGGELESKRSSLSLNLRNSSSIPSLSMLTPGDQDEDSDNDEPLLSGSGEVSKDCTEDELGNWADVLKKWPPTLKQRPRQLINLVRRGIPEALRGEVWLRLVGVHDDSDMMDTYRVMITKESSCEQVIQRDINRTFPAHNYFKETGGIGQDALYKISKAYSVFDEEVGYCQGLSFLAAALLLHMPEEQAFCVLVKIMYDYHLRDLFRDSFEVLHMKFYQLEKMMEDQMPELYAHFQKVGVEAHMFGSQWFLTLFTAKFPLFLVFHILDIYLCEGMDTIFQVALSLLMMSKKDLLALDFEGILKYFRVALPKKYRSEETARQLLRLAVNIKIKKLKKYEKEYLTYKEQERQQEDPVERLERDNKRLMAANLRLEQENDDLAHELVTSKIQLRSELDMIEDKADVLNKELLSTKSLLVDTEEEKKRLEIEAAQVKEMCRRELQRTESESARNDVIISDYKQICSQLSVRLEKEQAASKDALEGLKEQVKACPNCCKMIEDNSKGPVVRAPPHGDPELDDALHQIRELELELAQTKLALVEAQCRNQDLTHELNSALTEVQSSKNTWFQKTLTSIREVTKKDQLGVRDQREGT